MGHAGEDKLFGGDSNDVIYGGLDADEIFGGNGNDRIYGDEGGDVIFGNDVMFGGAGDDDIDGGYGDDRIEEGIGVGVLKGGEGADTFVFNDVSESGLGQNADIILDFDQDDVIGIGGDRFDFSLLDADVGRAGIQDLVFSASGPAAHAVWTELVLNDLPGDAIAVRVDVTGDAVADMEIIAQVHTGDIITEDAFIF